MIFVTNWIPSSENTYGLDLPDMLTPPDDLTCLRRPDDALVRRYVRLVSSLSGDTGGRGRRPVWSL